MQEERFEVVHIDNPNSFWVQYADDAWQSLMAGVEDDILATLRENAAPNIIQASQVS